MKNASSMLAAAVACTVFSAYGQQAPVSAAPVTSSTPGKYFAASQAEIKATVVAIDKATRTVTLKGPKGKTLDVVASDDVKNFDQIRVGDEVVAQYAEAVSLELRKHRAPSGIEEATATARAAPGERPAAAAGREINFIADVVKIDPAKKIISLKGPKGNIVDLQVQNPDHFKVVKKGDQVEVVYTQALAVMVRPAEKAAVKK